MFPTVWWEYKQILYPTEEDFRKLKNYPNLYEYKGLFRILSYRITHARNPYGKTRDDNIVYTHVVPIGWKPFVHFTPRFVNIFKILYFTFFDFSNVPTTWYDHEGDWEWTCHFVKMGKLDNVVYHYHGEKKRICVDPSSHKDCDSYPLELAEHHVPQRAIVYIEAQIHGSRWKVGCGWDLTTEYGDWCVEDVATGWDYENDDVYTKVIIPKGDDEQEAIYWFGGRWGRERDSPPGPRTKGCWRDTEW